MTKTFTFNSLPTTLEGLKALPEANLQDVERNKIKCGKLHFAAVSNEIKFDWVNSYPDFISKFGVVDSEALIIEVQGPHDSTEVLEAYVNKLNE